MTKQFIFTFLCLICLGACKSRASETSPHTIPVIDVDKGLQSSVAGFRLSDFVDSISYFPLYDRGDVIGFPLTMAITQNYAIVYDMMNRLVCYSFKERKSRQIGQIGRGPREYLRMEALAADESSSTIYALIQSPHPAVYKYNFDGNFLGSIPLDSNADEIALTEDGYLVVHFTNHRGYSKSQYIIMNRTGEIETDYPQLFLYKLDGRNSFFKECVKYSYNNELHMKDKSDTLYVLRGMERHPKYVFKNVNSIDNIQPLSQAQYDNAFIPLYLFETDTRVLFYTSIQNERRYFSYDKASGLTQSTLNLDIVNDLTEYPQFFRQITADVTYGDSYAQIINNPNREGDPDIEECSYFLMLLHLK